MTTVQYRPGTPVSGRKKAAATILVLVAAGVLVGTLLGLGALPGYQIALNLVGIAALFYAAVMVLRGTGRRLAVTLSWIAAFAMVAESGDHQARADASGSLGATNTEYFLPVVVWIGLLLLLVAAVAVTDLTKRTKGEV